MSKQHRGPYVLAHGVSDSTLVYIITPNPKHSPLNYTVSRVPTGSVHEMAHCLGKRLGLGVGFSGSINNVPFYMLLGL